MSRLFSLKKLIMVVGFALLVIGTGVGCVYASASVGQELTNPQLRDAEDNPATIPDFGTRVLTVTYADSSVSDLADPVNDATKAKKYDKALYTGIGVANMKDSTAPNFIIRKIVKSKIEKYKSTILTDPDLTLAKTWNLGPCKGKSVYVLIGKDKKIKYIKYADKNNPWKKEEIDTVIKMLDELTQKK